MKQTSPKIVRSTIAVESATNAGYTSQTAPDAAISIEKLATLILAMEPLDEVQYGKLALACHTNGIDWEELQIELAKQTFITLGQTK